MHAQNQFLNSQSSSGRGPTSVDVAGVVDLRLKFGVGLRTSGGGVSGGRGRRSDVEWRSGVVILLAPGSGLLMFGGWVVGGWGWWSSGFLSTRAHFDCSQPEWRQFFTFIAVYSALRWS